MVILATDFGWRGSYVGQMELVIKRLSPIQTVINLCSDLPSFNIVAASHLLSALSGQFKEGDVVVAVVDPGVGTNQRIPAVFDIDGVMYVGPDNGLFDVLISRAGQYRAFEIVWKPKLLSDSFHGRDLFAPIAACIANGEKLVDFCRPFEKDVEINKAADSFSVIYIDHYGNVFTGVRATSVKKDDALEIGECVVGYGKTFGDVDIGQPFWYVNSLGLVEISANQANISEMLNLHVGTGVKVVRGGNL